MSRKSLIKSLKNTDPKILAVLKDINNVPQDIEPGHMLDIMVARAISDEINTVIQITHEAERTIKLRSRVSKLIKNVRDLEKKNEELRAINSNLGTLSLQYFAGGLKSLGIGHTLLRSLKRELKSYNMHGGYWK